MQKVAALEFQKKFGAVQREALRGPVTITKHGRDELVLMSVDHYEWLKAAQKRTHRTAEAARVVVDAVERSEMDPEHDRLNALMD